MFLFLQGPPGPFARELGEALRAHGHRVLRINLCAGDWLSWHGAGTCTYRGSLADWPAWLSEFLLREAVTDVLYYADQQPYHRAAAAVARQHRIANYAIEFGYLRPGFVTLERGGMSTWSHFPADPVRVLAIDDGGLPDPDFTPYPHPFVAEVKNEMLYNLSTLFTRALFPRYHWDRMYNPIVEYLSFVPRLSLRRRAERAAARVVEGLIRSRTPYYVLPLQTETDYQIRRHSRFRHMRDAVEEVVESFARAAPADARLVVKVHPLQNGMVRWPRIVREIARRNGVESRVDYIDGGHLERLLRASRGVVLVNSTVGLHALRFDCPVKALGIAVFDVEGLTHQGPLDDFWREAARPDPTLRDSFLRGLAAATQIKGSFYTAVGRARAIEGAVERLIERRVNEPGGFVDPPPRLARAREAGVTA